MYQYKLQVINAEKWRYDGCFAGIKLASSLRTVLSPSLEIQLIVWSTGGERLTCMNNYAFVLVYNMFPHMHSHTMLSVGQVNLSPLWSAHHSW